MKTITEDERARVQALPLGPNAKATIVYLMRAQDLGVEDALLELANLAADDGMAEIWWQAGTHGRSRMTGVR